MYVILSKEMKHDSYLQIYITILLYQFIARKNIKLNLRAGQILIFHSTSHTFTVLPLPCTINSHFHTI